MEPTCFVPDTTGRVCDTACQPRCQCDEGFVRDQHGNCVALGQCPSLYCQENEVYTNSYNPCNENSCTATFGCVAPAVIKSGCMCKEGFVRDQVSGKSSKGPLKMDDSDPFVTCNTTMFTKHLNN